MAASTAASFHMVPQQAATCPPAENPVMNT